jgi:hypothetical protein
MKMNRYVAYFYSRVKCKFELNGEDHYVKQYKPFTILVKADSIREAKSKVMKRYRGKINPSYIYEKIMTIRRMPSGNKN